MRFDKFTLKAQEAVVRAQELAQQRDHSEILPLHLIAALIAEKDGVVLPLLQKIGADVGHIGSTISLQLDGLPRATGTQTGMARTTQDVFNTAQKEADRLKDDYVSTEHLLLALTKVKSETQALLAGEGVSHDKILAALADIRG